MDTALDVKVVGEEGTNESTILVTGLDETHAPVRKMILMHVMSIRASKGPFVIRVGYFLAPAGRITPTCWLQLAGDPAPEMYVKPPEGAPGLSEIVRRAMVAVDPADPWVERAKRAAAPPPADGKQRELRAITSKSLNESLRAAGYGDDTAIIMEAWLAHTIASAKTPDGRLAPLEDMIAMLAAIDEVTARARAAVGRYQTEGLTAATRAAINEASPPTAEWDSAWAKYGI